MFKIYNIIYIEEANYIHLIKLYYIIKKKSNYTINVIYKNKK